VDGANVSHITDRRWRYRPETSRSHWHARRYIQESLHFARILVL
jgi:hypothetical protein